MARAKKHNNEDFATTVGYEAQQWFTAHRKPSLSQWLDLVGKLEADNTNALTSYLHPTTAGSKSRKHEDAKSTLHKLDRIHTPERTFHARFFVRWLPAVVHAPRRDG